MKLNKLIAIPAIALAAGISLAACGTTVVQSTAPTHTGTAAPAPTTPSATTPAAAPVIINNNNNAAPAPVIVVPTPVYVPPNEPASDPLWSVAVAYTNDVNNGDVSDAWNMLGPSVQAGWNSSYNTYAAWVHQTLFSNVNEVSKSGDAVTFTFDLSNSACTNVPYTATFTVDNGIITSSTSSQT